jgi:hypothetical protein
LHKPELNLYPILQIQVLVSELNIKKFEASHLKQLAILLKYKEDAHPKILID